MAAFKIVYSIAIVFAGLDVACSLHGFLTIILKIQDAVIAQQHSPQETMAVSYLRSQLRDI
jgi:hypothetical protein